MRTITKEDYLLFFIYTMEYRALVMEQISHQRERQYLKDHPNEEERGEAYGVLSMFFCIRDLKGFILFP